MISRLTGRSCNYRGSGAILLRNFTFRNSRSLIPCLVFHATFRLPNNLTHLRSSTSSEAIVEVVHGVVVAIARNIHESATLPVVSRSAVSHKTCIKKLCTLQLKL